MNFAIIAGGNGYLKAPKDFGEDWCSIAISYVYTKYRHADIIMDMHDEAVINKHHKLCASLAKQDNIPYYCLDEYKSVPTSVRYPIENIIDFFKTDYFNSSVDYAIAFAIFCDAKKIALYGMSLSVLDEYFFQKASLEAWIWRAIGMGIEVEIGDLEHTALFHTVRSSDNKVSTRPTNTMYGYWHKQKLEGWPGHEDIEYKFPNHEKVKTKDKK